MKRRRPTPRKPGEMTLREVAKVLGISHARVQQIENRALAKLRKAFDALERGAR